MKIRIFAVLSLIFLLSPFSAYACLNPIGQPFVGQEIEIEGVSATDFIKNLTTHEYRDYWEDIRKKNIEEEKEHPAVKDLFVYSNNLAVALVHLGQIKEAIEILEKLENKKPGRYATASNLGTAYELNGENEKALEWIKEAINRDKKSHQGTEWLHVKILEAKIAMEKDSEWIKTHSVLGVDIDANPQNLPTDHLGQLKSLNEVEEALIYQLHERLEFVKPPEPIVADLLADLSRVFSIKRTPEYADAVKNLSIKYGGTPDEPKNAVPVNEADAATKSYFFYSATVTAVFLAILAIYFFVRKNKSTLT